MKRVVLYYLVIAAMLIVTVATVASCKKEDAKTVWHTVLFESNGGNEIASQTVNYGSKATDPGEQTREGFTFGGWFTDDGDFNTQWNFATDVVIADITLYAKWEQCVKLEQSGYSVTVWGGINGTASITSEPWGRQLDKITVTASANSGYRFLEWQAEWQQKEGNTISIYTDNPAILGISYDYGAVVWKAIFVPSVGLPETIDFWQDNRGPTKIKYHYDNQNRFTYQSLVLYNIGYTLDTDIYLDYDANGNLAEYYMLSRDMSTKFSQNSNKITFILDDHNCVSCFQTIKGEFELDAQGLPVQLTYEEEYSEGFDLTVTWRTNADVSFIWQNGNMTKTERKSETEREEKCWYEEEGKIVEKSSSASTTTYTHDDKKTPFSKCNTPKWFFLWIDFFQHKSMFYGNNKNYNKNNIKTETIEGGSTITYEYTYNDDGFPVTRTWEQGWQWIWGYGTTTFTETYTYH